MEPCPWQGWRAPLPEGCSLPGQAVPGLAAFHVPKRNASAGCASRQPRRVSSRRGRALSAWTLRGEPSQQARGAGLAMIQHRSSSVWNVGPVAPSHRRPRPAGALLRSVLAFRTEVRALAAEAAWGAGTGHAESRHRFAGAEAPIPKAEALGRIGLGAQRTRRPPPSTPASPCSRSCPALVG